MALVYDHADGGPGLPTYVPRRRRRTPLAPAFERVLPLIASLGATVTFRRFMALVERNEWFTDEDQVLARNCWAIGFHEGVRAQARLAGRELPPFEEAYLTVEQMDARRGEGG